MCVYSVAKIDFIEFFYETNVLQCVLKSQVSSWVCVLWSQNGAFPLTRVFYEGDEYLMAAANECTAAQCIFRANVQVCTNVCTAECIFKENVQIRALPSAYSWQMCKCLRALPSAYLRKMCKCVHALLSSAYLWQMCKWANVCSRLCISGCMYIYLYNMYCAVQIWWYAQCIANTLQCICLVLGRSNVYIWY